MLSKGDQASSLPRTGEPNSIGERFVCGVLDQERLYGRDGRAVRDRDFTDHGNPKKHPFVPHDHLWENGERQPWIPPSGPGRLKVPSPAAPPDAHEIVVGDVALVVGAAAVFVWIGAIVLALPSKGGTIAAAAVLTVPLPVDGLNSTVDCDGLI